MLQTTRRALRVAAIAAVAAAGLLMTGATGASANPGTELTYARGNDPTGGSTPPAELVIPEAERNNMLALIEGGASLAETSSTGQDRGVPVAAAAQKRNARTVGWTQTGVGSSISQNGSMLLVAAVKNSLDGDGAVVSTVTLNGNGGTDAATRYQANGVQKFKETFTLGAADANGVLPYTGSGTCTGPGTGVHKQEKCSYTFTGTLNSNTNVLSFNITGTTTR